MNQKNITARNIATDAMRLSDKAYEIIRDHLDALENEQSCFGHDSIREHDIRQLESIAQILRAQRETMRSLRWMIEDVEQRSKDDQEFADLMRNHLDASMIGNNMIRLGGTMFLFDDDQGIKEDIIRRNLRLNK